MLSIAHRGASGYAPENTHPAFELAIGMNADLIETDVQLARSGELILFHDDLVDRTSDGSGPVGDHSLDELRRLDLGSWMGSEFADTRIVTLEELWAEFLVRIPACLEIKNPLATMPLLKFLTGKNQVDRVHLTSFSWSAIVQATEASDLETGFLCRQFNDDIIERCARRGLAQICPPVGELTVELVAAAHARGLTVRAWGVRERSDIDRLYKSGVDGATCDWPDWITNHPLYKQGSKQ